MKEKCSASKLLAVVLCLQLASVAITVIDSLFYNDFWLGWIQRGITVAVIVCFFRLHTESRLYGWTAALKAAALGLLLIGLLLSSGFVLHGFYKYFGMTAEDLMPISSALYWLRLVVNLPALVLEYLSHGKTAPSVRKGWIGLTIVNLVWIVAGNVINRYTGAQFEAQLMSAETLNAIGEGFQVVNLVLRLFYLWLLYRTVQAVKARETE